MKTDHPPFSGNHDKVLSAVKSRDLPADVQSVVEEYDRTVGERDHFLWKWLDAAIPQLALSTVEPRYEQLAQNAKLLASVFVSTVDDVAEIDGDWETYEEATKIPFGRDESNLDRPGVDPDLLAFARDVWEQFESGLGAGPRSDEFEAIRHFDLRQVLNAIEYSYVANQHPETVTEDELWAYDSHNMMVLFYADVDLAFSPAFDRDDLGSLRRILLRGQRMARIGNWTTTWERELYEGDVSSGVIGRALEQDVLSLEEVRRIRNAPTEAVVEPVVERIRDRGLEDAFVDRWRAEYDAIEAMEPKPDSIDVRSYLDGLESVMHHHLASEGLK